MTAGQVLESLVRVFHAGNARNACGAHSRLDWFTQDFPVFVEVCEQYLFRDGQAGQALGYVVDREQRVAERGSDVALAGRVSEVALHA